MKNAVLIFLFLVIGIIEGNAMSFFNHYSNMTWEWPAGRPVKHEILVEVIQIDQVKKLLQSPSFAKDLPDSMLFKGKVLKGEHFDSNLLVKFELPKVELDDITQGSMVVLGMVDGNTVVSIQKYSKD